MHPLLIHTVLFLPHSTIIKGESSLAKERTSVASLHRWTPPQDPDVTALLYDVGGHKSYQNTAHCFQVCLFITIHQQVSLISFLYDTKIASCLKLY